MASLKQRLMLRLINLWPPFAATGIHVSLAPDMKSVHVTMKLRFWNRNFVGTHYGGSLYSMTDPFYMLMLIQNLGPDYVVWDKAAHIRFRRPGTGTVDADFRITDQQLAGIREQLKHEPKLESTFIVEVRDESGEVVAVVEKVLHIRKK